MFQRLAASLGPILFVNALHGCSPAANQPTPQTPPSAMRPRETQVPPTVVTPQEALSVNELYARGMQRLSNGQYALAAEDLETAATAAPEQPWVPVAYYNAGIARDESGAFAECARDFKKVVDSPRVIAEQRDAHLRLIRVLVYLERWQEAGQQADAMLERYKDPRTLESVVIFGAKALSDSLSGHLERAQSSVELARNIIEREQFELPVRIHRDVAVVYFALGEIRRKRAEAIAFVPPSQDFPERLEQRCQLLLDAQSAYSNSMRAYDSHWSLMAGYRVGMLYARLHSDLMDMLGRLTFENLERKKLFEAALRLRYSVLLTKATGLMEHSLELAARTNDDSSWVQRVRQAYAELEASRAREEAALQHIPYSREELRAALEGLKSEPNAHAKPQSTVARKPAPSLPAVETH